jgi:putative endonuclease
MPPPPDPRRTLGEYGEQLAARYLQDRGLEVLDRNWRCGQGEVDLVARDGDCLVFCEVKTRRTERFGAPVEAVTRRKAARLRRLAAAWLQEHEVRGGRVRIDVIGILRPAAGPARLRHVVGVGS